MRTTGRSDLVCWSNDYATGGYASGRRWELPCPTFARRVAETEMYKPARKRAMWLAALWLWLFGPYESAHAVFAREPPVRLGEMRKRPGVLWPRVVTMRFIAGGESADRVNWGQVRVLESPRMVAWRERRASILEVVRHHGAAVYREQSAKLSDWLRGAS